MKKKKTKLYKCANTIKVNEWTNIAVTNLNSLETVDILLPAEN